MLIYYQVRAMIDKANNLELKAQQLETNIEEFLERWNIMNTGDISSWLSENLTTIVEGPINFIGAGLTVSVTIGAQISLIFVIAFLFLYYRDAIASFIVTQMAPQKQEAGKGIVKSIVQITQRYLLGMFLLIMILGTLISIGLWLLGIPHAFFWGYVGAALNIVPYIGTTIGGVMPFVYSLFIMDTWWQPIGIVLIYVGVQTIDGYFITPVVVGDRVQLNVVTAILSLIIGNAIWGIPGMIIAIPMMAIIKIIMEHIPYTQPIALLLSSKITTHGSDMHRTFTDAKHRFITMFLEDEEEVK
jgi:predicted PurR-regulated permease PerM